MEVHLDSSSANKLVREDSVSALIRRAHALQARLYFASPIIDELLSADDDAHLRAVAQMLLRLFDSACFRVATGLEPILKQELQSPVVETPIVTQQFRRNYRVGLRELLGPASPSALLAE